MNEAQKWYIAGGAYRLNRNPEALDSEEQKLASDFITMFDEITPIDNTVRLYRGIGHGSYAQQIGQFWSTSSDEDVAKSYTSQKIDMTQWPPKSKAVGEVLIIDVMPGVRIMRMGNIEREYVIEKNVSITETMRKENGITYIWLTVTAA